MQQTKALIQSKVFWLAVIQAAAAVLVVFNTNFPQIGWLLMVKSAVDIVLRMATDTTITSITQS